MLRKILIWAGLLSTLVFGYLAVRGVQPDDVAEAIGSSRYGWLPPAFVVLAFSIFLRAVRWRAMYVPEMRPPLRLVTQALVIGYFFNNLLPARAGEAARVIALHQRAWTSRAQSTGTVVIERAYDLLSLLVLLFVALPWLPEVSWLRAAGALAVALAVAIAATIAVLAIFEDRAVRVLLSPLRRLGLVGEERIASAAWNLTQGLAAIRRPRLAIAAFMWTTASWLVMALSFWLVMLAFDLDLPPVAGLFVLIAVGLAMVLPSSPAAAGVFEAAAILALLPYGVPKSLALSYALVVHAVNFVLYIVGGAVVLRSHALSLRRARAALAQDAPD